MKQKTRYVLAALRIVIGWTFLWAFLDKLLGLGLSTAPENAWLTGGSPTYGFLTHATAGPLAGLYQSIAGAPVVDAMFMFGLAGLGVALILGIGLKITSVGGPLMMLLMWSAHLPPAQNPLVDQHIVYALVMVLLAQTEAGMTWGLGAWWRERVGIPILE
jgi:thiosulfate dehydrogenase (quinone) large subunit